ncbi:MAG: hypothetical protein RSE91_02945, partial [Bacilli bacterium]
MKKNFSKKTMMITSLLILLVTITLIGGSYAIWSTTVQGSKTQIFHSGTLDLTLGETAAGGINITNAYPMTQAEGMATTAYTFTLKNVGTLDARYEMKAINNAVTGTRLDDNNVRYSLIKNGVETSNIFTRNLDNGVLKPNETNNYTLRIWVDHEATNEIQGQKFSITLQVTSIVNNPYNNQDGSGAEAPKLTDGLIPVTYNSSTNNWVKADVVNGIDNQWYDYDKQMWANAVTTTATNRNVYQNANAGTTIPMSDINTMWVWIPRYEYMHSNMATGYAGGTAAQPGGITINFLKKANNTPTNSNYTVHPS